MAAATKIDIIEWINRAKKENARWLLIVSDDYDYSDYPISFKEDEMNKCLEKISDVKQGKNMQRLMEVYDLKKPIEDQINAKRAMEIPSSSFTGYTFSPTQNGKNIEAVKQIIAIKMADRIRKSGDPISALFEMILEDENTEVKCEKLLDKLSIEQRYELFSKYCKYCGDKNPKCQCHNDE